MLDGDVCSYEFGGPTGVLFSIISMPLTVFYTNSVCSKENCSLFKIPSLSVNLKKYFNKEALFLYITWLAFQWSLHVLLSGKIVEGQRLKDGTRLKYKCNGFACFVVTLACFGVSAYMGHDVTVICDVLPGLLTTATLVSILLSGFLYLRSFSAPLRHLSPGGATGNPVYDFHLGRELNPRIGDFDLKFFCELRPGLMAWILLDLSFLLKSYTEQGYLNFPLFVLTIFQTLYVADALYFEESVLTTFDITTEGFGFMLVFGDLTWVPGVFSLQAQYLYHQPHPSSTPWIILLVITNSIGYLIFRSANNEKDQFRRDPKHPSVRALETISCPDGRELLVSSWWGTVRHPNYLGDVIMATSWSMICGFDHALPWYYFLYLTGALVHRAGRDGQRCSQKYGETWEKYCERVPYKIIPGIF